jgi:cytochrome c551/c552
MKKYLAGIAILSTLSGNVTANECLGCHKVIGKDIGPSFLDISKEYSSKKEPVKTLTNIIYQGSDMAVYNQNPGTNEMGEFNMYRFNTNPQHVKLDMKDAKAMAEWILSIK